MNPSKNRQRGKRTEKAIAKRIGGKRIGILGKSDVEHACFSFEVKSRKKFVAEKYLFLKSQVELYENILREHVELKGEQLIWQH